jgi:CRP-like cAMP-binding protein
MSLALPLRTAKWTDRLLGRRGWFIVDLLSVLPLDLMVRYAIGHDGTEESLARSGKLVRLLRLARFAKIARLAKLASLRKHSKSIKNKIRELGVGNQGAEFVARILFLTVSVYFLLHVVGCLWIFQARLLCKDGLFPTWYAIEYRDTVGIDFDNSSDIDDLELQQSPFLGRDPQGLATHPENARVYVDGIYYVLVTMGQVGYGEILPLSSQERFACSVTIIAGAFVWAYIIGTFDSALAMMDRDKAVFDEWMRQIKAMLRYQNIPYLLEFKIDAFFAFKYESKTLFNDEDIIGVLPDRLRRDLQLHRFREIIKRIPFFIDLHDEIIVEVVERMVGFTVLPGDYVYNKGDPYTELILLKKGRLAVVAEHSKASQPEWGTDDYDKQIYAADTMEAEYYPGAFFGESQFLGFETEREVSIRARTFCECFSLHPEDMDPVLRMYPKLKRRLTHYSKMKKNIEQRMSEEIWLEEMKSVLHDAADSCGGWKVLFESMDVDKSGELDSGTCLPLSRCPHWLPTPFISW